MFPPNSKNSKMSFYPSWKSCQLGIQFVSEIPMFHGLLNGLLVRINKYMFFDLQQMFLKILQGDVQNPPGHESRIQIFFCLVNITSIKHVEEIDVQNLQVYQFYPNTQDIYQPFWWNPELDPSLSLSQPTIGPPCLAGHRRPYRSGDWTNGDFMGFMADLW